MNLKFIKSSHTPWVLSITYSYNVIIFCSVQHSKSFVIPCVVVMSKAVFTHCSMTDLKQNCIVHNMKIIHEAISFWIPRHIILHVPRLLWRSKKSRVHYFATNARLLENWCTSLYTTRILCRVEMCLLISCGSSFCPCILHWTYVFICLKCLASSSE
jgi:hypothetical protein